MREDEVGYGVREWQSKPSRVMAGREREGVPFSAALAPLPANAHILIDEGKVHLHCTEGAS